MSPSVVPLPTYAAAPVGIFKGEPIYSPRRDGPLVTFGNEASGVSSSCSRRDHREAGGGGGSFDGLSIPTLNDYLSGIT